jgi:hypothetical protein
MTASKNSPNTPASQRPIEKKRTVTEAVMPIAASGVGGGAAGAGNAVVSDAIKKPKKKK